ncbi:MAG: sugar-binding domain-containing protein, partial [Mobilitalea sp.]
MNKIDLTGTWSFCLDKEKIGIEKNYFNSNFDEKIELPATVSTAKKGIPSKDRNIGSLTDPYLFEGYTWYSRNFEFPCSEGKEYFLVLERTRISHLWIDGIYIGSNSSLCTSHKYCITPYLHLGSKITIMIDNTSYLVGGGHM